MAEFNGRSLLTIDSKGRLFLPQGYRELLGKDFVISLSSDMETLAFYCKEDWEKKSKWLRSIPEFDRNGHVLRRTIFSSTFSPYNTDSQGRVLIPQAIRQEHGLVEGAEVLLLGVGSTLEIWNNERYRSGAGSVSLQDKQAMLDYINATYFKDLSKGADDNG